MISCSPFDLEYKWHWRYPFHVGYSRLMNNWCPPRKRMRTWVWGEDEGNGGGEIDDRPEVTWAQLLQFQTCSGGLCEGGTSLEMWYFLYLVWRFEPLTHEHHMKMWSRLQVCCSAMQWYKTGVFSHRLLSSTDMRQIVCLWNLSEGVKFICMNHYIINARNRGHKVPLKSKSPISTITIFP